MSKTDELISKLEDALQLSKECINLFIDRETKGINPKIVKINKLKSEISELKEQIKKEKLWTNDNVIDLVNWYLRLCKIITDSDCRFELENQSVIDSFLNGDDYKLWWNAVNPEQTPDLDCGIYEEKYPDNNFRKDIAEELSRGELIERLCEMNEQYTKMRKEWFNTVQLNKNETHPEKEITGAFNKISFLKETGSITSADTILNKEITDEEIEKQGGIYEKEYEESIHAPDIPIGAIWANEDFVAGAKWMRKQMSHEAI